MRMRHGEQFANHLIYRSLDPFSVSPVDIDCGSQHFSFFLFFLILITMRFTHTHICCMSMIYMVFPFGSHKDCLALSRYVGKVVSLSFISTDLNTQNKHIHMHMHTCTSVHDKLLSWQMFDELMSV